MSRDPCPGEVVVVVVVVVGCPCRTTRTFGGGVPVRKSWWVSGRVRQVTGAFGWGGEVVGVVGSQVSTVSTLHLRFTRFSGNDVGPPEQMD